MTKLREAPRQDIGRRGLQQAELVETVLGLVPRTVVPPFLDLGHLRHEKGCRPGYAGWTVRGPAASYETIW